MPETVGLRERKKLETRNRIENSALVLFDDHGFEGTTVEAIAKEANISPRTFFHYFETKEDVLLADYTARLDQIVAEIGLQPSDESGLAALRASFLIVAADFDSQREQLGRRFRVMATSPSVYARSLQLQAGWEDSVAIALAKRIGVDSDDLAPRMMAASALAAMRTAQRQWMVSGQKGHLPELVSRCFDLLASGLRTPT